MAEVKLILNNLVQQIATELNLVDYDIEVKPISSGGANYTSTLYDVTLSEGGEDIYMFAKVAAIGEKMRSQAPKMYKTECYAYMKLSKIYENLENEHQVPQEHRLTFCKLYGCNTKPYEEIIVLENLFMCGFKAYDRFKCMSREYAYSALRELAKFHALSFAFAEYYPEVFHETAELLKYEWDTESEMMTNFAKKMIGQAIMQAKEELKEPLKNFFDVMPKDAYAEYITLTKRPVLGHGDYKLSNLMYRNRDDGTVDIKIVDLQTMQSSSPVVDLLYFIFTGSDEKFRALYYEQLLDHYYTQLHAAMKRLQLDPEKVYSRADFYSELNEKLPLGLLFSIFALPIVTVEEANAPKVDEDLDLSNFSVEKTSDLYTERLNGVVNDYVKWGILK